MMIFREAGIDDIDQLHAVRCSVRENVLSDPGLITGEDYKAFLTVKGKGWVCETDGRIAGFTIVDLTGNNLWALFLRPEFEGQGIGRQLHRLMLDWYFSQTPVSMWLGTEPGSRAADFYRKCGWTEAGVYGKGEIRFEMSYKDWAFIKKA